MRKAIQSKSLNGIRAIRHWAIPYIASRIYARQFRPVLCHLFTEWSCNIDCHYCHQHNNDLPGMDFDTAKRAMDWVKSLGCRVISIMGGEPLVRKDFILEVIRYGAENGLFMYLPTNGYLMDRSFIDEAGRAGVAAINLAVDCVAPRKGLPKALLSIEPQFRYLVEQRKKYGYVVIFNFNICRTNIKDVKVLTEIARQNQIGTDYHLTEPPQNFININHFKHTRDMLTITPDEYDEVDQLLDWLISKQRQGWYMVNSIEHLKAFKDRMRGSMPPWDCRAGHNGFLIRHDGTLSPCFDLITYDHDWGYIGKPIFDKEHLKAVQEKCLPLCSSTCFYTLGHYYKLRSFPEWIRKYIRLA